MTFVERVKTFGKKILKGFEVAFLIDQYNKALSPYDRENCAYSLRLVGALAAMSEQARGSEILPSAGLVLAP